MTAQISDCVRVGSRDYNIAAIQNELPFSPFSYGLEAVGACTACWRGYYCLYEIADNALRLRDLNIWLDGEPPVVNGVSAARSADYGCIAYQNVNIPVPYTGGIVLAADFIQEMYVHMGFHPPHCYRDVWEFVLEEGKVVKRQNCSAKMRQIRRRLREAGAGSEPHPSLQQWIADCFSLSYDVKRQWE